MPVPPFRLAALGESRRFVFISTCPEPWGGSEELWFEAACELRAAGHRIDVLKTRVDQRHPRIRRLLDLSCSVRDLNRMGVRASAAANAILPARLGVDEPRRQMLAAARFLIARRPHLAIVCQGQNYDGAHLGLMCDWLGVPYMLVVQKASELKWPSDWMRPHVARVFGAARRSVFVSEHNLRVTEAQIGGPIRRAAVVRNPVLVSREGPQPWPDQSDGLRLACVGRLWVADKGQDVLLSVLARARWRGRPVHVSFYGEGSNREGLQGLALHLGLESVSFEGQSSCIEEVWRSHHGLVLPSRAEGLPLALVETMMCGRVPVITDVGGNAEVVEDGETGFLAASPTVAAFDDALERAWQARAGWRAIGEAAARRIAELVPEEAMSPLTALALEESAGRPPAPHATGVTPPTTRRTRTAASRRRRAAAAR